jgi:NADH-quinone oxidoreductase subunit C
MPTSTSGRTLAPAEIGDRVRAQFGDDVTAVEDQFGHAVITVSPARYRELAQFLRDDPDLALDYFDFSAGVDMGGGPAPEGAEEAEAAEAPSSGPRFQVITHLFSTRHNHHVRLKVGLGDGEACQSLSSVYPGANWHERETWELFGIVFEGHPHLVKLLLPEPFEGHPLRKDFELMSRVAKPWPGAVEGEEEEEE